MKHPHIRTGRSLVGLTLILFGLSAYGCGDSATVTEPASLGNLSVSEGTLTPRFSPDTTSYTVQLSTDVSTTTITATPRVAGDTIRINNQPVSSQAITLDSPGAEESVNIVVTETGTGGTSRSYTVRVKRAPLAGDNSLINLTVTPGALAPPFDKNLLNYTVSVDNNIGRITVTPTLSDPLATMTVNGQAAGSGQPHPVDLKGGGQVTPVTITVTAQNGSTKSYEVTVSRGASRNNNLSGLTVSSGSLDPSFRADRTAYTVNVGSGVSSVTVRPTLADTSATMTVNGQTTTSAQSQTFQLNNPGSPTIITIIVIAQDGSPKAYSVAINRAGNNNLSALTVSSGSLDPSFRADRTAYTVNVGSGVSSVTVRPTLADTSATMTVNGQAATSGQSQTIGLNNPGLPSTVTIIVFASNQAPKQYTVTINRAALSGNNNLSALTVSPGTLSPTFSASTSSYTVNVGSTVTSVTVTARLQDTNATMTIEGQGTNSGQSRSISLGEAGTNTVIDILVTAPNGTPKAYTVTVNKAALSGNNNLSALTVSPGTLDPSFRADRTAYTVNVGSTVTSVTVTARLQDTNATMTIEGQGTNSGQSRSISLGEAGTNTVIDILVTAPNGTAKAHTLTVNKAALGANNNLSALTVSPGTFDSPFNANDLSYIVTVDSAVGNVTVSATKADSNATMALGSVTVPPGTASGQANFPLNGAGGENTAISVTVTAQNGVAINTYTISVFRPATPTPPAKPAIAPDLLTADDSCPLRTDLTGPPTGTNADCAVDDQGIPFGTRDDNFTTVTTPRFTIPQPASGHTPNLYVDGNKVGSNFNAANNTLQPTTPLSGNNNGIPHSITSTVTNTATNLESQQSDPLPVTISTGQTGT
ncbi:cadherin-like beta sandwich domain-containing protein [Nitrospira sp. BLG_1]|uniref:cadherin-like beta sandwich domain-containing protein n=1 Tax=Nitrospira sp. BLG_1 TaxID=3395883 RepID=UPI0039BD6914